MKVIIVSKTHMTNQLCVGGLNINNFTSVRLLDKDGNNQPNNTNFEIGQIWELNYTPRNTLIPPHIEDVLVEDAKLIGNENVKDLILSNQDKLNLWKGSPSMLFEGKLSFTTAGSGYISRSNLSNMSVGFWIPDRELSRADYGSKVRFCYGSSSNTFLRTLTFTSPRYLTYVGCKEPPGLWIDTGSLLRVSLARWWSQDITVEERCYLQLSGVY